MYDGWWLNFRIVLAVIAILVIFGLPIWLIYLDVRSKRRQMYADDKLDVQRGFSVKSKEQHKP